MTPSVIHDVLTRTDPQIAVERSGGNMTVSLLSDSGVDVLGTFSCAADAWSALDKIDAPAA
jgi:hypothetical protein